MSARLCIGPAVGDVLVELPLPAVDVLLDFATVQGGRNEEEYRGRMRPFSWAASEGPGDPPDLDVWAHAESWTLADVTATLSLCASLLRENSAAWQRDPDWLAAGLDVDALLDLLTGGKRCLEAAGSPELSTWIVR
jgi:hypothetical protein